jgi:hypothetical protein
MLGWTDPVTKDEIAIIGMMDGTAFVQVTVPTNPIVLGFLPQTGSNNVIWVGNHLHEWHLGGLAMLSRVMCSSVVVLTRSAKMLIDLLLLAWMCCVTTRDGVKVAGVFLGTGSH